MSHSVDFDAMIRSFGEALLIGRPSTAPELEEQPEEPEKSSDGVFVCVVCGKINNYWNITCEEHDDGRSDDGEDN